MISLAEEFLESLDKILTTVGFERRGAGYFRKYYFDDVYLDVGVSFDRLPKVSVTYGTFSLVGYLTYAGKNKIFICEDGTVIFDIYSREESYPEKELVIDILAYTMNDLNSR